MKITVSELRDMVAEAVKRTLDEAPKKGSKRAPKEIPDHSVESDLERRDRQVRATGYSHADEFDFSKPLGPKNLLKRQGASGIGNWTSESTTVGQIRRRVHEMQIRRLIRMVVAEEIRAARRGR